MIVLAILVMFLLLLIVALVVELGKQGKALEDAGLDHHRLHDCRHTFAVNSIRAGDDIKTIQENMGHYSAAFTLDRYGHVTETMRQESANRMQAFIQGMSGNEGGNT